MQQHALQQSTQQHAAGSSLRHQLYNAKIDGMHNSGQITNQFTLIFLSVSYNQPPVKFVSFGCSDQDQVAALHARMGYFDRTYYYSLLHNTLQRQTDRNIQPTRPF